MVNSLAPSDADQLYSRLYMWWVANRRTFPWRESRDPYSIFIAEVLLHRTRAAQVAPVYQKFLTEFPNVQALAAAEQVDVAESLRSLGLRWRVSLLLQTARIIVTQYLGKFPSERDKLEELPGVGHYIACAIRCFAFGYPEAVVDTNTVRVASRFFGFTVTDSSRRSSRVRELVEQMVNHLSPRESNFALLDLAALVCVPREPRCSECPLREICYTGKIRSGSRGS